MEGSDSESGERLQQTWPPLKVRKAAPAKGSGGHCGTKLPCRDQWPVNIIVACVGAIRVQSDKKRGIWRERTKRT